MSIYVSQEMTQETRARKSSWSVGCDLFNCGDPLTTGVKQLLSPALVNNRRMLSSVPLAQVQAELCTSYQYFGM